MPPTSWYRQEILGSAIDPACDSVANEPVANCQWYFNQEVQFITFHKVSHPGWWGFIIPKTCSPVSLAKSNTKQILLFAHSTQNYSCMADDLLDKVMHKIGNLYTGGIEAGYFHVDSELPEEINQAGATSEAHTPHPLEPKIQMRETRVAMVEQLSDGQAGGPETRAQTEIQEQISNPSIHQNEHMHTLRTVLQIVERTPEREIIFHPISASVPGNVYSPARALLPDSDISQPRPAVAKNTDQLDGQQPILSAASSSLTATKSPLQQHLKRSPTIGATVLRSRVCTVSAEQWKSMGEEELKDLDDVLRNIAKRIFIPEISWAKVAAIIQQELYDFGFHIASLEAHQLKYPARGWKPTADESLSTMERMNIGLADSRSCLGAQWYVDELLRILHRLMELRGFTAK